MPKNGEVQTTQVEAEKVASEAGFFTRADLLAIERPKKVISHPKYPGQFEIQALSAFQQSQYSASLAEAEFIEGHVRTRMKMEGADGRLCVMGVIQPSGLTFSEWGGLPNDLVAFLAAEIREVSGMNVTVEEAKGN